MNSIEPIIEKLESIRASVEFELGPYTYIINELNDVIAMVRELQSPAPMPDVETAVKDAFAELAKFSN